HVCRRGPAGSLRQERELREAAIPVNPHGRTHQAEVSALRLTEIALPAPPVGLDRDPLAGGPALDGRSDGGHLADELVSRDEGVPDGSLTRPDAVVRPADPRGPHAHENLARRRHGLADRLQIEVPWSAENRRSHTPTLLGVGSGLAVLSVRGIARITLL